MQTETLKPNPHYDHVYAIVRVDTDAADNVPFNVKITVKKIVSDANFAEAEVKRLNELNAGKGCIYFFQVTRLEKGVLEVFSAEGAESASVPGGVP